MSPVSSEEPITESITKIMNNKSPDHAVITVPTSDDAMTKPVNPFTNATRYDMVSIVRMIIVGIFLLVPRAILLISSLFILWCASHLVLLTHKGRIQHSPLKARWWNITMSACARSALFSLGYVWIQKHGKPAPSSEAPIVVSNHCTLVDMLFYIHDLQSAFVSKAELSRIGVVWTVLQALQCIIVDRNNRDSKNEVREQIKARAESNGAWQHTVIFPEGTTANQKALISFKPGAFAPGVPVQPVRMLYGYEYLDPSLVGTMTSARFAFMAMLQLTNSLKVYYLEKYVPNELEKMDPILFANNVRHFMATGLGSKYSIPVTSHSFLDVRLQIEAQRFQLPQDCCQLEMHREFPNMSIENAKAYVQRFARLDRNRDGVISFEDFHHILSTNPDPSIRQLAAEKDFLQSIFDLLDIDHDHGVTVRDFFIGMSLINMGSSTLVRSGAIVETNPSVESNLMVAFGLLDRNGDNFITRDELEHAIELVLQQHPRSTSHSRTATSVPTATDYGNNPNNSHEQHTRKKYVDLIMKSCDVNKDGRIDLDEFVKYASNNTEVLIALARAVQLSSQT